MGPKTVLDFGCIRKNVISKDKGDNSENTLVQKVQNASFGHSDFWVQNCILHFKTWQNKQIK